MLELTSLLTCALEGNLIIKIIECNQFYTHIENRFNIFYFFDCYTDLSLFHLQMSCITKICWYFITYFWFSHCEIVFGSRNSLGDLKISVPTESGLWNACKNNHIGLQGSIIIVNLHYVYYWLLHFILDY